ncbi:DUF3644 domain-containing protein [uncultured Pseudomonas sp.]|uniref:DUF3644 domain-containing protein n=1 Tax=uncultured Pseudomonas sp. TaxID=114707 RepID=UPI003390302B
MSKGQEKRNRTVHSVSQELIKKSREAALAAVQIFNNPALTFKSEIYIVLMIISWTYLLHSYYRKAGIEYRYHRMVGDRKKFDKTAKGAHKYWELERCLNENGSPVDKSASQNLRFLIGLRHEIEHQMTTRIDELLSARFQACCLNYNSLIKTLYGDEFGIDKHLSFSLQFSSLNKEQVEILSKTQGLPENIHAYIKSFDEALSDDEFNDPRFSYRVFFVPKTANRKGQADQVIEFIKADSDLAIGINAQYAVIKETERKKYLPGQILKIASEAGYPKFNMTNHTNLWKGLNAKDVAFGYGVTVAEHWYWYESWVAKVIEHCKDSGQRYK